MSKETLRLRMFAGPNGSGKSTFKSIIRPELLGIFINPDEIEKQIRDYDFLDLEGYQVESTEKEILDFFINSPLLRTADLLDDAQNLRFNDGKLIFFNVEVNAYFASVAADFIRHKLIEYSKSFTFETVMSFPDKVELLRNAQLRGYRTYLYYVATEDPAVNISRVRYRVKMGGHSVPEDKIVSRYQRSLDLVIRSISQIDEKDCIELFSDPIVMEKFGTGLPHEEKKVQSRLSRWLNRWRNHDPFSVYAILEKNSGNFMGIISIEYSYPGVSDTFYLIHQHFWGKGYGNEIASAVFQSLIPRLMLHNYKFEHASLKKIVATARLDNVASQRILQNVGFQEEGRVYKYGSWRYSYVLFAKQLRNQYQSFFNGRNQKSHQEKFTRHINEDADITAVEMASSQFGQSSYTARAIRK